MLLRQIRETGKEPLSGVQQASPAGANLQHMRPRARTQKLLLYAVSSTKNAKTATK